MANTTQDEQDDQDNAYNDPATVQNAQQILDARQAALQSQYTPFNATAPLPAPVAPPVQPPPNASGNTPWNIAQNAPLPSVNAPLPPANASSLDAYGNTPTDITRQNADIAKDAPKTPEKSLAEQQKDAADRVAASKTVPETTKATDASGPSGPTDLQKASKEWLTGNEQADQTTQGGLVSAKQALDAAKVAIDTNQLKSESIFSDSQAESAKRMVEEKAARDKADQNMTERNNLIQQRLDAIKDVDPDRRSIPQKILGAIAIGLGAYGAGITHSHNFAMETINNSIANDVAAQKSNIEKQLQQIQGMSNLNHSKDIMEQRRIEMMSQEREFLQKQAKDHIDFLASNTNNAEQKAKLTGLSAGLDQEIAKTQSGAADRRYQVALQDIKARQAAGASQQARAQKISDEADKAYDEVYKSSLDKGDSKEVAMDKAETARLGHLGRYRNPAGNLPAGAQAIGPDGQPLPTQPTKRLSEQEKAQLGGLDDAIAKAKELKDMLTDGGEFSPSRTAKGEALVGGLYNAMARAETGGTRAPSEPEIEILNKQIPQDPNAWQFTGKEAVRIDQTLRDLQQKRKILVGQ